MILDNNYDKIIIVYYLIFIFSHKYYTNVKHTDMS